MRIFIIFLSFLTVQVEPQFMPNLLWRVFDFNSDYSIPKYISKFFEGAGYTLDRLFLQRENVPIEQDVTFYCLNRESNKIRQIKLNETKIMRKINVTKPVVFIIHGYFDNYLHRNWMKNMMNEYIAHQDVNVCSVDWNRLAIYEYLTIAKEIVPEVGRFLTTFIKQLTDFGVNLGNVTLVGHSLGAQIAGITGNQLEGKLDAIYALDPAGPAFTQPSVVDKKMRLDPLDAKFVQAIYTTSSFLGARFDCGHQNFYPNGGVFPQPSCLTADEQENEELTPGPLTCSHDVAHSYFKAALNPKNVFEAYKCESLVNFQLGLCLKGTADKMGIYSKRKPGRFYLTTKAVEPYV